MKSTFYFHSVTPLVSSPLPVSSTPVTFPLTPPPHCMTPPALSGSCSWSNTPCCGWSNGTKSGVSVRFGPLQPATASWIQSADTSMESKTWWSCDARRQSVDTDRSFLFWWMVCYWLLAADVNKRLMTSCSGEKFSSKKRSNYIQKQWIEPSFLKRPSFLWTTSLIILVSKQYSKNSVMRSNYVQLKFS